MRRGFFIILFFTGLSAWSNTTDVVAFFKATKNKDYAVAGRIATKMEDPALENQLHSLLALLQYQAR